MTEHDPTAIEPEPDEASLPPKPPVEQLPEEGIDVSDVEPLEVPDEEFLSPDAAAGDDTIDDAEQPEEPHDPSTLDIAPD